MEFFCWLHTFFLTSIPDYWLNIEYGILNGFLLSQMEQLELNLFEFVWSRTQLPCKFQESCSIKVYRYNGSFSIQSMIRKDTCTDTRKWESFWNCWKLNVSNPSIWDSFDNNDWFSFYLSCLHLVCGVCGGLVYQN